MYVTRFSWLRLWASHGSGGHDHDAVAWGFLASVGADGIHGVDFESSKTEVESTD